MGGSCLRLGRVRSGEVVVEEPGMKSGSPSTPTLTLDILGMTIEEMRSLGGRDGGDSFRCLGSNDRLCKPPKSSGAGRGFGAEKV
jgi:hypothetical protein